MTRTLPIGSVSIGTMRLEDVIPAILLALDPRRITLSRSERGTVQRIEREYQRGAALESNYFSSGSDSAMYDLERLYDIADAHCPDYCTFGPHPGDGADLGVWPCEELFEDTSLDLAWPGGYDGYLGYGDTAPDNPEYTHWLQGNDHGNATLYRRAGTRWIECWSTV